MPPSFKVNDVVKRFCRSLNNNTNITGRVVEICQNTLFLNILWENNTVASLEKKQNLRRAELIIPQTLQERVAIFRAVNAQEPIIPTTLQARVAACRARQQTTGNSNAPINKDAKNYKVIYIYVLFVYYYEFLNLFLII